MRLLAGRGGVGGAARLKRSGGSARSGGMLQLQCARIAMPENVRDGVQPWRDDSGVGVSRSAVRRNGMRSKPECLHRGTGGVARRLQSELDR